MSARSRALASGSSERRLAFAAVVTALAVACGGAERAPANGPAKAKGRGAPGLVSSNVRFSDYAGTQACASCHPAQVAAWLRSPMHNMTRVATKAEVHAPFDGTTFSFKGDTARLESSGGERFVTLAGKYGSGVFRVTRVIGGHHREDYAGVPVAAAKADAQPLGDPTEELVLPVSFVYATKSLRYKGYSVMVKERSGLRAGPVWNQTCIFCHNTVPYLSTVLGALAGKRARPYQGEVVDPLLPERLRAEYAIADRGALRDALEEESKRLGASKAVTPEGAISATRASFRAKHLVEVGIGCESCHLGSREHVEDPAKRPSLEPRTPAFRVRLPEGIEPRAARINRTCARCHQVLFSGYQPTWEGGTRDRSPGGAQINSGEARDLMLGSCASKLTCVECHDPHSPGATDLLRKLSAADENALCTRCHDRFETPEQIRAHTHHDPAREGARCLSCHMPMKNMSLDGDLSRYHRIGSPTDPERVLLDRPLECALCHADKTVADLVSTMEKWWNKSFERGALTKLYGALDANVLLATAERGKPHEQAVAFHRLGDARVEAAVPILAGQLTHPYPLVRGYAKRALDAIEGQPVPIDIDADDAQIDAAASAWLRARAAR